MHIWVRISWRFELGTALAASSSLNFTPSLPPGTNLSSEGIEFHEMASLHARMHAFVTLLPC